MYKILVIELLSKNLTSLENNDIISILTSFYTRPVSCFNSRNNKKRKLTYHIIRFYGRSVSDIVVSLRKS